MIFGCLDFFFRCLGLYFGFWTYILTVRTYIFGFWTYILGFGLVFRVFGLIFGCLNLYFGCLNLYFPYSGRLRRVGRAAGLGEFSVWGKIHFGNLYLKKLGRRSGHFSKRILIYES